MYWIKSLAKVRVRPMVGFMVGAIVILRAMLDFLCIVTFMWHGESA